MSNYKRLCNIETALRDAIADGDSPTAIRLIREALVLAAREPQVVGRVLEYAVLLDYAHRVDRTTYEEVKDRFLTEACFGHGWKMGRMFRVVGTWAETWGETELREFCARRTQELKDWNAANREAKRRKEPR